MNLRRRILNAVSAILFAMVYQQTLGEMLSSSERTNSIGDLYNNILQREYAGPIVFPNHMVERKAQRSPSLRLRFGRRSDPEMDTQVAVKRWFGDVNQKPIRSPSLRLRFGRRSDPSVPLNPEEDYYDDFNAYERMPRKPQRLRWGRNVPFSKPNNAIDNNVENQIRSLETLENWNDLLLALQNRETENDDDSANEFQREIRKPATLRLRFGRSTNNHTSTEPENTNMKDNLCINNCQNN